MSESKDNSENKDQEKLILIIANKPKGFESAANFLSRRGYPCSVMADIRQAIKIITAQKPAYVFLSWNLRNAKVLQTYSLLTRTFHCDVIVFAELTDSKTAAELANAHLPQTMQAPVSGPGIYMRIQRIEKAKEDAVHSAEKAAAKREVKAETLPPEGEWESAGVDPQTGKPIWRFKSESGAAKGSYTYTGDTPPTKDENGVWKTPDDSPLHFDAKGSSSATGSEEEGSVSPPLTDAEIEAMTTQVLQSRKAGKGPVTGEEEEDDGFGSIMKIGSAAPPKREAQIIQKEEPGQSTYHIQKGSESEAKDHIIKQEALKSKEHSATQEGLKAKDFSVTQEGKTSSEYSVQQDSKKPSAEHSITQQGHDSKEHSISQEGPKRGAEFAASEQSKNSATPGTVRKKPATSQVSGKGTDSILAKSSSKALNESVTSSNKEVIGLESVEKIVVLIVQTQRFRGHLVVANSAGGVFDSKVLESLRDKLAKYLSENGETLKDFEVYPCDIKQVSYEAWSKEKAEFSATAGHLDHEWAIAFFPDEKPLPNIEDQEKSDMVCVDILDVLPEEALPFDVFIFLPVNGKHFLYVRKGKKLGKSQRDRLSDKSVTKFFIKKSAVPEFKNFCVANRLNFSISEISSSQAGSAKAS